MCIPISVIEVPARKQTDEEEDNQIYDRYCSVCHASLNVTWKGPALHTLDTCLKNYSGESCTLFCYGRSTSKE